MENLLIEPKKMRSTIRDVANLAGVTPGTASLALNRDPQDIKITIATINRVKMAAKTLRYKPNLHAKRLADGVDSHPTVTVMTPIPEGFGGTHNHEVLAGILEKASTFSFNVNLRNTVFDSGLAPQTASIGSPSLIDGVILHTWLDFPTDVVEELLAMQRPFILANHYVDDPRIPCVGGDMFSAGVQVAEYLVNLGHRNIAALLGPAAVCKVRSYLAGIRAALTDHGLELPDSSAPFGSYDEFNKQQLYDIIQARPRVTALICMNDNVALSAIGALSEKGLSVPRDISVTGFGNASFSALVHPQLTTMDEKGKMIGTETMGMLLALMDDRMVSTKVKLSFDLIARETTAPPSRGD